MKTLTRFIKEQRILDPSELVLEGRIKNMSETEWLNSKYKRYQGAYVQELFGDASHTHAICGILRKDVDKWKDELSQNKGISKIKTVKTKFDCAILYFKYDRTKDEEYKDAVAGEDEEERKAAEKFAEEVKNADTSKYSTDDKHIAKMKSYFNKHSDPERLINSIKDDKKLVARWIAAMLINWADAVCAFGNEIERRKLLNKAEIVAYTEKYKEQKVDDSDMKRLNQEEEQLVSSWITKSVYKYFETLQDYEITWKETFKNAKTYAGRRVMSKNGRAWTEGFVVTVSKGNKSVDVTFDIVTNEGGGLYGYVLDSAVHGNKIENLKNFKTSFKLTIEELLR